jgi:hypothetical protein
VTATFSRWFRRCAPASLALALCTQPGGAQSPLPEPVPTTIGAYWYDRAYDRWRALPRPRFATYDTDFAYTLHGKRKERKQHVAFRYHDGRCLVVGVPLDSRDRPDKTQITDRCFGPDFSFAFVQQRLGGFKSAPIEIPTVPPTQAPATRPSGAPATIAVVRTRARPYDVTFAGYETEDGKNTIHLTLTAIDHPADHILTGIWIDPETLGVVHLRAESAAGPSLARVIFEASYDEDATTQVLTSVIGYLKAQVLLVRVGVDFSYQQTNFEYPDDLPDWYFDQTLYDAHQKDQLRTGQSGGVSGAGSGMPETAKAADPRTSPTAR